MSAIAKRNDRIAELFAAGLNPPAIAKAVEMSSTGIYHVLNRMNLRVVDPTAGWTEQRVALACRLWKEGATASHIAKTIVGGLSRNAVIGKIHRLGLAGKDAPYARDRPIALPKAPKAPRLVATLPRSRMTNAGGPRIAPSPPVPHDPASLVSIHGLTLESCRNPITGEGGATLFCGLPKERGSYCAGCASKNYTPQWPRKEPSQMRFKLLGW